MGTCNFGIGKTLMHIVSLLFCITFVSASCYCWKKYILYVKDIGRQLAIVGYWTIVQCSIALQISQHRVILGVLSFKIYIKSTCWAQFSRFTAKR